MSDSDELRATAIRQLKALGLSTYAARTFVALACLGDGTAEDVSDVADVPRTRVYDAVDELQERGLVDVQQSTPKRFWSVSTETAGRQFEQEYVSRVREATDALEALAPEDNTTEQLGVWTVTGRDTVTQRVVEFIEGAQEEVVYMTTGGLHSEAVTESLYLASDRNVSIRLAGMSDSVERTLGEEIPTAEPFDSLWEWSDTPAGRLLMVDQEKTLVSVLVDGEGGPPEPRDETAIWGVGTANSLVVVLKTMFTWQLDRQ